MDTPLSVVIAPDSFKGSIAAASASAAIARGWAAIRPHDNLTLLPQADGGEGTLEAIATAVPGSLRHEVGAVTGPDGRPTAGAWLELPGQVAVVELAQCSGLPLMNALDPLGATTLGLGQVIRHALEAGMTSLVIGLGGSASTDGGAGALTALGLELLDARGEPLAAGGGALGDLATVRRDHLLAAPPRGVTLLTDVAAPLLGLNGAAAVFGPQKGAMSAEVQLLDAALARFATLLEGTRLHDTQDQPGAGAAGGAAYGFAAAWGAAMEPGARYIAALSGLTAAAETADVILTGEGRFDATSSTGKVVGEVLALARQHGTPVGIVAGQLAADAASWAVSLTDLAGSSESAIARPIPALEEAGRRAARHFGRGA